LKGGKKVLEEWIRGIRHDGSEEGTSGKSKWSRYLLAILVCIGLLALIWPLGKHEPAKVTVKSASSSVDQSRAKISQELEGILSQVEGAGQVSVSISLLSDGLKNYASNTKNDVRETSEQDLNGGNRKIREENLSSDVAVSGGSALLVEEKAPLILGVLVVAEGAGNPAVKEELGDATATLLNLSPHQVRVLPRKGE
jgi:stage III sporulation protein AG